ncbi:MAG TPA: hypothetical protein VLA67_10510 [Nitrospiraceae bacterium]|nr:hypothetical protein [Nitrospiraceae bacterium]
MVTIRTFSSILIFALLLWAVFPVEQIDWPFNFEYGSTGDTGSEQPRVLIDAGKATDSEDDPPQETLEDCVASRLSALDCQSSRSHVSMTEIPQSTLLISRLFHPPTAES